MLPKSPSAQTDYCHRRSPLNSLERSWLAQDPIRPVGRTLNRAARTYGNPLAVAKSDSSLQPELPDWRCVQVTPSIEVKILPHSSRYKLAVAKRDAVRTNGRWLGPS